MPWWRPFRSRRRREPRRRVHVGAALVESSAQTATLQILDLGSNVVGRDGAEGADKTGRSADRELSDRADAGVFAPGGQAGDVFSSDERARRGARRVGGAADEPDDGDVDDDVDRGAAAAGGDGGSGDPIPVRHLTTASDAFYPSVALNALLRVLRDPSASSRHHAAVSYTHLTLPTKA